ncbi:Hypothetical predicted protein [Olea europaea subsp. europaea]|uniref:Vacuolar protein sorting-associated protein 51 homolog n=1 Tax=Olea europaea subsp. europaea TaxID=158383 RepID=A0A8S0PWE8_OLEEU|nr:Hypothetical predicted protein [Olea europaea subsp. europaea]
MEIFTKTENTQQIQLDTQFLKSTLKDIAEDEAAIDFLLDEVIDATTERCLDPVPLEPLVLDRLVKAKLTKTYNIVQLLKGIRQISKLLFILLTNCHLLMLIGLLLALSCMG